jgi:hypothetical protein
MVSAVPASLRETESSSMTIVIAGDHSVIRTTVRQLDLVALGGA